MLIVIPNTTTKKIIKKKTEITKELRHTKKYLFNAKKKERNGGTEKQTERR